MDNEYTATFFGWNDFGSRPERRFKSVFVRVAAIARAVSPQQYVGEGWNSSISKVLDNAIVGFCLDEGLMSRNKTRRKTEAAMIQHVRSLAQQMGREDLLQPGRSAEFIEWLKKHGIAAAELKCP